MSIAILASIVALILGACISALIAAGRISAMRAQLAAAEASAEDRRSALATAQAALAERAAELKQVGELRQAAEREIARMTEQIRQQETQFSERLRMQEQQANEKLALLTAARVELSNQFKALANEILEEKSRRFTEQNQENLSQLLTPLSEKIKSFQQKVEEVYVNESKDRSALGAQVQELMKLNQTLSQGTERLTNALTTQSKAQGDFGEMILAEILEKSGLREGEEYVVQSSFRNENARNVRPDVILRLPEEKHLVIDSKVSLTAYNEMVNAGSDDERRLALAQHMDSVRRHIRELADKNYHTLHQLQSIDFVCMFIPIEGAFMAAIGNDSELWAASYERNVLMVSPSTLLFVVRTVAHLWRQERQKQNVQEIVSRAESLYEKLVGFVEDLQRVGSSLDNAQGSYSEALKKLSQGKGNVIRQAQMLVELGVKPKKSLPPELVESVDDDEPLFAEKADAAGAE